VRFALHGIRHQDPAFDVRQRQTDFAPDPEGQSEPWYATASLCAVSAAFELVLEFVAFPTQVTC
jgi:hypothetical protein